MSYDLDIAELIQQYRIATTDWHCTLEQILAEPRYQRVWDWWTALAHYKLNNFYERLEEAEKGNTIITVMGPDLKTVYKWDNGRYIKNSEMRIEEVKSIYSE